LLVWSQAEFLCKARKLTVRIHAHATTLGWSGLALILGWWRGVLCKRNASGADGEHGAESEMGELNLHVDESSDSA
jgi:hypothetical protein